MKFFTRILAGVDLVANRFLPMNAIRFRKYRVALRLGTNAVRRRLLFGLHACATATATKTG